MITASTYTLVVVPLVVIALAVGAVLWSNASARQFDLARAGKTSGGGSPSVSVTGLSSREPIIETASGSSTEAGSNFPPAPLTITTGAFTDEYLAQMKAATSLQTPALVVEEDEHDRKPVQQQPQYVMR